MTAHLPLQRMVVLDAAARDAKISELSDRLSGLQRGLSLDQAVSFSDLLDRVASLEEREAITEARLSRELGQAQAQADACTLQQEHLSSNAMRPWISSSHDVSGRAASLQAELEKEQAERRSAEAQVLGAVEARARELRLFLDEDRHARAGAEGALRRILESDLPDLAGRLGEEVRERERWEQKTLQATLDEIGRLRLEVEAERRHREETEELLLRTTEDIVRKLQTQVAEERQERREGVIALQKLLEDTSARLTAAREVLK